MIDSHTGGEPTRVVLEGAIPLSGATMAERRRDFAARFDHLRSGIVNEPRGSDVLVGAVLTEPVSADAAAGVVFFNNVGYLGMCGHGTIGVVETLRHLGRIGSGEVRLDTPAGPVDARLRDDGQVEIRNVLSYRFRESVAVEVEDVGKVVGDVAYGGNWFFVVHEPSFEIRLDRAENLAGVCQRIRGTLHRQGVTGADGAEIDHVELTGPSPTAHSRNYVLCPGGAYDRSPCGTGTSAKMACLHAAGRLAEGEEYLQESVTGSLFRGRVEAAPDGVVPTIVGSAHVTAEATLLFDENDPLQWGFRP